jgi:hypothetical protein
MIRRDREADGRDPSEGVVNIFNVRYLEALREGTSAATYSERDQPTLELYCCSPLSKERSPPRERNRPLQYTIRKSRRRGTAYLVRPD